MLQGSLTPKANRFFLSYNSVIIGNCHIIHHWNNQIIGNMVLTHIIPLEITFKIESKGIKSIRSRVANISEFLTEMLAIEEFRNILLTNIFGDFEEIPEYVLSEADWRKIHQISEERYQTWEWNYGKSPEFNFQHSQCFPIGSIDVRLEVNHGIIELAKIYGDFFGVGDVQDIENCLKNIKYDRTTLEKAIENIDLKRYFGDIAKEEFLKLIY